MREIDKGDSPAHLDIDTDSEYVYFMQQTKQIEGGGCTWCEGV